MIWYNTNEIGCAAKFCDFGAFVVCKYYPRGNVLGWQPYLLGAPCSKCPQGTAPCKEGLCVLAKKGSLEQLDTSGMDASLRTFILEAHNRIRGEAGAANMRKLEWSNAMKNMANGLAAQCRLPEWRGSSYVANGFLYTGTADVATALNASLSAWNAEKEKFNTWSRWNDDVVHYVTLVWAGLRHVGCAVRVCDADMMVVCAYSPKSWFMVPKYNPFMRGQPCSMCYGRHVCEDNLCIFH